MSNFGRKLKKLRTESELSVRGFAAEIEKSAGYISRVEGRGEIPSIDFVIQVAKFFEVDAEELLELAKADQLKKAAQDIEQKHEATIQLFRKGKRK